MESALTHWNPQPIDIEKCGNQWRKGMVCRLVYRPPPPLRVRVNVCPIVVAILCAQSIGLVEAVKNHARWLSRLSRTAATKNLPSLVPKALPAILLFALVAVALSNDDGKREVFEYLRASATSSSSPDLFADNGSDGRRRKRWWLVCGQLPICDGGFGCWCDCFVDIKSRW